MTVNDGERALAAFNGCPNQQLVLRQDTRFDRALSSMSYYATCPRYPEGVKFVTEGEFYNTPIKAAAAESIGCLDCPFANDEKNELRRQLLVDMLHQEIGKMCGSLFVDGHFPHAVLFGYITVKERMRDITGYELTTHAKGKGGLRFPGAPEHVDNAHQDAATFLLMAVDAARNRFAHSLPDFPPDPIAAEKLAYAQLNVSSLAMFYLDNAEIKTTER